MTFDVHDIAWEPEKVVRFWSFYARSGSKHEEYFSKKFGASILDFAQRHGALGTPVLDFGCGPGFLLDELCARHLECRGLDLSADSVAAVNQRLHGQASFGGAVHTPSLPSSFADASFSTIFCIETVEHLLDSDLDKTLAEIHRLLQPGGSVVITTPNDEDLLSNSIMCPDCGCVFHRVQHVRSFSVESLSAFLRRQGFHIVSVQARALRPKGLLNPVRDLWRRAKGKRQPHLMAVARR